VLFPELPVGKFDDNVELSSVAGVFLDQMEQDAFERGRRGTVPAGTGLAHLGQIVGLDDGTAALALHPKGGHEVVERLLFCDIPAVAAAVAPRIRDRAALEAPFEPPQLDICQMLEQLDRCPTRRQTTLSQRTLRQLLDLADDARAEVVEVSRKHVGSRLQGNCRFRERHTHECEYCPSSARDEHPEEGRLAPKVTVIAAWWLGSSGDGPASVKPCRPYD